MNEIKSDQYICTDLSIDNVDSDKLKRINFVKRIVESIKLQGNSNSYAIGIYGAWGEGKTSVLKLIEDQLQQDKAAFECAWFNPWRFKDEEELINSFYDFLSSLLKMALSSCEENIGEIIELVGKCVKVSTGNSGLEEVGKELQEKELSVSRDRISSILKNHNKKIVIFIDDIDRLDKTEIQTILRLVKFSSDLENIIFVLAFDKNIVAKAIADRYGNDIEDGIKYLEKIIQVPLFLPPSDSVKIRKIFFDTLEKTFTKAQLELDKDEFKRLIDIFINSIEDDIKTVRQIKNYFNSLLFYLPLLKDEINFVDMLCIEWIKMFRPDLYEIINRNSLDILYYYPPMNKRLTFGSDDDEEEEKRIEELDKYIKSFVPQESESIKYLLVSLFPSLKEYFDKQNVKYSKSTKSYLFNNRRVGCPEYFSRYFLYAIPETDSLEDFFQKLFPLLTKGEEQDKALSLLNSASKTYGFDELILKLRKNEKIISDEYCHDFALLASKLGVHINKNEYWSEYISTQLKIFIYNLVERVKNRDVTLGKLASEAEPLLFSIDLLPFVIIPEKDNIEKLYKFLANRIDDYLKIEKTPIFKLHGQLAYKMFFIIAKYQDSKIVQEYLDKYIVKSKENLASFLRCVVNDYKQFDDKSYEKLTAIVDPSYIKNIIDSLYKDGRDKGSITNSDVAKFLDIYSKNKEKAENVQSNSSSI